MNFYKRVLIVFVITGLTFSCFDDLDDNAVTSSSINDFVWKSMNLWYYWQQDVPDLADDRFISNEDYTEFLNSYNSPNDLFDDLLHQEDRFSWIVDDYNALLNSFQGIVKTNGVEFGLSQINGTDNLFGVVYYILPNSDASSKNIQRGDLFTSVNGTQLTLNNYRSLLFGDNDSYTLNMSDLSGNTLVPNGTDVALTKMEYNENPIYIHKVIEVGGIKIGYLMYNSFTNEYDEQLNAVFGDFKAQGIDELVLDLRYNSGGSVSTAINLSSMITGQYTGDLFLKQQYNDKIQALLSDADVSSFFVDRLNGNGSPINSLNLSKVYILAQRTSASASELVINALDPYLQANLIHIGSNTRGKNEFSTTLFDIPQCAYRRSSNCDGQPNPNHTWALQPLIGRNANAIGFLDYDENGLTPDISLAEDLANFGVLGDVNEPLLARAIQHITGGGRFGYSEPKNALEIFSSSKFYGPLKDNMYIDLEDLNISF